MVRLCPVSTSYAIACAKQSGAKFNSGLFGQFPGGPSMRADGPSDVVSNHTALLFGINWNCIAATPALGLSMAHEPLNCVSMSFPGTGMGIPPKLFPGALRGPPLLFLGTGTGPPFLAPLLLPKFLPVFLGGAP
ncbi:hypothetical protein HanRHA438_Chr03g0099521 [Helianthus annuus]|nr:hypothetical protein HanRHA438_Chr03g0099521 [Helianthus annuus]